MGQLHVGVVLTDPGRDLAPQLHGLEHIGLVDRAHLPLSLARGLESHSRDALDLGFRVAHGVEGFTFAGRVGSETSRLAEVEVTGQLAQDHDVQSLDHFALEGRSIDQLRKQERGPEVREQPQRLAQTQQARARPHVIRDTFVPGHARRPEENGVGLLRYLQRSRRQRVTCGLHTRATHRRLGELEGL